MDTPKPIIVDKNEDVRECDFGNESNMLNKISYVCNKYMTPKVLCPWQCSEFIFHKDHV